MEQSLSVLRLILTQVPEFSIRLSGMPCDQMTHSSPSMHNSLAPVSVVVTQREPSGSEPGTVTTAVAQRCRSAKRARKMRIMVGDDLRGACPAVLPVCWWQSEVGGGAEGFMLQREGGRRDAETLPLIWRPTKEISEKLSALGKDRMPAFD